MFAPEWIREFWQTGKKKLQFVDFGLAWLKYYFTKVLANQLLTIEQA